jgi:hypothetical protein
MIIPRQIQGGVSMCERKELKEIFNRRLNTICFDEYIDEKLAGDFIYNLLPLLEEETCQWSIERAYDGDLMWMEVHTTCGEKFHFENGEFKEFSFCPHCGGKMKNKEV